MLTLSQPEGADYAHHIVIVSPKKFRDHAPTMGAMCWIGIIKSVDSESNNTEVATVTKGSLCQNWAKLNGFSLMPRKFHLR